MAEPETPQPEGTRAIPVVWTGVDELPMLLGNAFVGQVSQGQECILVVGQVQPPMIFAGNADEIAEQAANVRFVESRAVARIGFTRGRLVELINTLQITLENHDKTVEQLGEVK